MEEEHRDSGAPDMWQRANGTGGDMPTGYRPCPFCHAVIPWASERCPSCGRVLIERAGVRPSRIPQSKSPSQMRDSWWRTRTHIVVVHFRKAAMAVQAAMRRAGYQINRFLGIGGASRRDPWATTSRGTSWSVFRPAARPTRSWWPTSLPRPTQRERQILLVTALVMGILFVVALIF